MNKNQNYRNEIENNRTSISVCLSEIENYLKMFYWIDKDVLEGEMLEKTHQKIKAIEKRLSDALTICETNEDFFEKVSGKKLETA